MTLTTREEAGRTVVALGGSLGIADLAELKPALTAALAGSGVPPVLDLAAVTACDTAGIQLLLAARKSASLQGASPAVTAAAARIGVTL